MALIRPSSGQVHVIVGPMFAGKTTALLRRIRWEESIGRSVAMIKSSRDTRFAKESIVTHDGLKFPCWALPNLSSFHEKVGSKGYECLDVIGIDEAQFFGDLHDFCKKAADQHGKIVIVAGLDGDYMRRSFGSVLAVVPIADSVTKLSALCGICGERAFFTLRRTDDTATELIGAAELYMPVCREHYVNGQVLHGAKLIMEPQKTCHDMYNAEATSVVTSVHRAVLSPIYATFVFRLGPARACWG